MSLSLPNKRCFQSQSLSSNMKQIVQYYKKIGLSRSKNLCELEAILQLKKIPQAIFRNIIEFIYLEIYSQCPKNFDQYRNKSFPLNRQTILCGSKCDGIHFIRCHKCRLSSKPGFVLPVVCRLFVDVDNDFRQHVECSQCKTKKNIFSVCIKGIGKKPSSLGIKKCFQCNHFYMLNSDTHTIFEKTYGCNYCPSCKADKNSTLYSQQKKNWTGLPFKVSNELVDLKMGTRLNTPHLEL